MLSKSDMPFRDSATALSNSFWVMWLFVTRTIELSWGFLRDLAEIEEGDAERLCNLCDGFFVFSGESCAALFVEELEDAHQILVVRHDRVGQDLFRLESSPLVVGRVVDEGGVDALQFGDVIGVGNAHWAKILCTEPSQALLGDGNAEFLDAVDVRDFGENLFLLQIEREDGEIFSIENAENFLAQVEENVVKIAGRMNLVRDALDVLGECHFLLKVLKILRDGIGLHYMGSRPSLSPYAQ